MFTGNLQQVAFVVGYPPESMCLCLGTFKKITFILGGEGGYYQFAFQFAFAFPPGGRAESNSNLERTTFPVLRVCFPICFYLLLLLLLSPRRGRRKAKENWKANLTGAEGGRKAKATWKAKPFPSAKSAFQFAFASDFVGPSFAT